ncbi:MAG: non-homologous end-joining DNA ligase [Paludibacteraceae bacterium]
MLAQYKRKRDFKTTPEPSGSEKKGSPQHRFVVQRHQASHLHYDFRLQLNGVLKSWAIPKGPSANPSDKRLAVQVEDHPVSYINFSGTIPKGNYGAGTVAIWDKGFYTATDEKGNPLTDKQAMSHLKKGELKFILKGKKLKGSFVLIRLKNDPKNWLFIKHKDRPVAKKKLAQDKAGTIAPVKKNAPAQHTLKHFYKPMLATLFGEAFNSKDWVFEIKWDGYRAIAESNKKELKFYSRNGHSFLDKYPAIAKALSRLRDKEFVVDGEVVATDKKGRPSFQLLQQYNEHPEYPLTYYIFDLLFLEGKDTRQLPLLKRKALLKKILPKGKNSVIRFCEHVPTNGIPFYKKIVKYNLEGMIAKKADSVYATGRRSKDWLKIKFHNSREAIIAGVTQPKGSRQHIGALILSEYQGKKLVYIGHAGTGFTDKTLRELAKQMQPYIQKQSPFATEVKVNAPVTWLKPTLVCQVKYTERTNDGMLRHPVYMGLRKDKTAEEVQRVNETPEKNNL